MRYWVNGYIALTALIAVSNTHSTTLSYPDFSSVAGLTINGDAAQVGSVLRVVHEDYYKAGSAFSTTTIGLNNLSSFSTFFEFQISTPTFGISDYDGIGADGLVFVVQTVDNNVGGSGGGIGYAGINPSLGIEFDTYNNGSGDDYNGNHVGININGNMDSVALQAMSPRFNNGSTWYAWVDYDGANENLEVRLSQANARPSAATLTHSVDLAAVLGKPDVYVGFTAGTGAGVGNHDILSWEFESTYKPIGVPDGGITISLLAAGFCSLHLIRRKLV